MQKEWDRNDADRHPKTPKHHFHDIPPNREIHFVFEIEYSVTVSNEIVDKRASIEFEKGPLLMVMSRD